MTTTKTEIRRPLTAQELARVEALVQEHQDRPADLLEHVLVFLFRSLMGAEAYDRATSIKPGLVQLPKAQVMHILETCMAAVGQDARTHFMLGWLNYGPSSYDLED